MTHAPISWLTDIIVEVYKNYLLFTKKKEKVTLPDRGAPIDNKRN